MSGGEIKTIDKKWFELKEPIKGLKTDTLQEIRIEREIIPIIFVPGIMASRLKLNNKKDDPKDPTKIWDPDDPIFMLGNYGVFWMRAGKRKLKIIGDEGFNPAHLEVDNDNADHNKQIAPKKNESNPDTTRAKRGWGGVMWSAYGDFLVNLQNHEWPDPLNLCFEFPVHAFGYNWTDTNRAAGLNLKKYIDEIIGKYRSGALSLDKEARMCHRVILITHSMGGMVARSACLLHGAEKDVLGVLHGVQPAAGAPDAYWRMKAGTRRADSPNDDGWDWLSLNPLTSAQNIGKAVGHTIEEGAGAWVLGTDGREITATLGNMPGGLELLPGKKYKDNDGKHDWLQYPGIHEPVKLPKGNPYKDIYQLKDDPIQNKPPVPYRMINPDWLDPGKHKSNDAAWEDYLKCLQKAEEFRDKLDYLEKPFHPNTYQFYAGGIKSVDKIEFIRRRIGMKEYIPLRDTMVNRGGCQIFTDKFDNIKDWAFGAEYVIELAPPLGDGDGTVPSSSGKWLNLPDGRTARLSPQNTGEWLDLHHQPIYKVGKVMEIVEAVIWNFAQARIEMGEIKE